MAVQSDTSSITYTGNNSTVTSYAVPFYFLENSHLAATAKVTATGVETTVTLTNHTGAGDANGGTVRTAVAIPATSTLTIFRTVPATQTTTYQEGGDFPAASHERALDKLTFLAQQNERAVTRSFRVTEGSGEKNEVVAVPNTLLGLDATNQPKALTLGEVKSYLALTDNTLSVPAGIKTFADAGERALAVPDFTGQLATQRDTGVVYVGTGTSAGDWAVVSISDLSIVNADIASDAAIAGTKIAPAFGNQDITVSTGNRSITNTDNFALSFGTNNAERMRITQAGNVGVGTNGPRGNLEIRSSTPSVILSESDAAANNQNWDVYVNSEQLQLRAVNDDFSASGLVVTIDRTDTTIDNVIFRNGNVAIGNTTPSSKLVVVTGSGQFENALQITESTHATSRRSGLGLGEWVLIQDANGNGTKDFAIYQGGVANTVRLLVSDSGEVRVGGTTDQGAYNLQCNGTGVWGAGAYVNGSDERLKDNIADITEGLEVVNKLRPVSFNYKPEHSKDTSKQAGFIAQELLIALAGKDYLEGTVSQGPEFYNVAYQNLIPVMAKAIQELSAKVDALEQQLAQA